MKNFVTHLFTPSKWKRTAFFLLLDAILLIFCFYFSFYLRFGFTFPAKYFSRANYWLPVVLALKLTLFLIFKMYKLNWRFVGIMELRNITWSLLTSTGLLYLVNHFVTRSWVEFNMPRGIIIIDAALSFLLVGFLRISKRLFLEAFTKKGVGKRTLIIGADITSERLAKELKSARPNKMFPVAFVDESIMRIGTNICGIPVFGGHDRIPEIIAEEHINSVLINLPRDSHRKIAQLFDLITRVGVEDIKIVPNIDAFNKEINVVKDIKNLDIDDLLSRESVKVDYENIRNYLREKTILVTGAAGSIGSEIMRKLVHFGVARIVGFEIDETEVFNLSHELAKIRKENQIIAWVVGDVRDRSKVERVLTQFKPHIIFHASAYKHVPLMEEHPEEAVKTNVFGALNIVRAAVAAGVEKFINISTDKAVNPTSIMGATKRFSENLCRSYNNSHTRFTSVRFGNVLGSRGSVIPLFLDQIKSGGPVTVTDPEIQRYFMSIPEAVLLVFQAAFMSRGEGGETFVLDMGEPVKIVTLAQNLIRLNNMEPGRDIEITYTGLRPGEKLFEELLTAEEGTDATTHEKIYIARGGAVPERQLLENAIAELNAAIDTPNEIRGILKKYVPYYGEKKGEPENPPHHET